MYSRRNHWGHSESLLLRSHWIHREPITVFTFVPPCIHIEIKHSPPPCSCTYSKRTLAHHHPHMLLHTSAESIVTKHVFCHLQTRIHSTRQPRPHTHTKDPGAEELCVRSTSQPGKTSGKGLCSGKLLLNELICHWYAKSCYKEREWDAGKKRREETCRGHRSEIWEPKTNYLKTKINISFDKPSLLSGSALRNRW